MDFQEVPWRPLQVKSPFDDCCKPHLLSIAQNSKILFPRHSSAKGGKDVSYCTIKVPVSLLIKNVIEESVTLEVLALLLCVEQPCNINRLFDADHVNRTKCRTVETLSTAKQNSYGPICRLVAIEETTMSLFKEIPLKCSPRS